MDAMLEEKLSVDEFWQIYVGNATPLEFMNRLTTPEIDGAVDEYVNALPDLFGIVRRQSWKLSFEAPIQFRRGEVASAIREKLEKTEAEWRPHLNQRPPAPVPVATAGEAESHEVTPLPGQPAAEANYEVRPEDPAPAELVPEQASVEEAAAPVEEAVESAPEHQEPQG